MPSKIDATERHICERWVSAASDALEHQNTTHRALCSGGDTETVKLCLFASIVPNAAHVHYMNKMTALHNKLIKQYPQMVSTRPEVPH